VKRAARSVLALVVAVVPHRVARRFFAAWIVHVSRKFEPRRATRELLEIDRELEYAVNHAAIRYGGGVHPKHLLMRYHDFFVERVAPGERVLDLGCGKGELAFDLADRAGAVVLGVDRNAEYLAFARDRFRHKNLRFVQSDILEFEPEQPFDVVVMSNVLEHIEPRPMLLRRIAAMGPARFLVRIPQLRREWQVPLRQELGLPYFSDSTHVLEYDPETIARELGEAGFEVAEQQLIWGEIWVEARLRR
jgi:SAM-dependent methyltransferase